MSRIASIALALCAASAALLVVAALEGRARAAPDRMTERIPSRVGYGRDIRPILSNKCFVCHGPNDEKRKVNLRLDVRENAIGKARSGTSVIAPGDPAASEMVSRITASDPDEHMPPVASGKTLDAREIELLERWIAEGAEYEPHWAFVAPKRLEPPSVENAAWPKNEIDRFVLGRLEAEGLKPSAEASQETLIRRVTLDLTGLPPSPEEVDAFVTDARTDASGAYERLVDRLLSSPHYGEEEARHWLDQARYGDTHGYHLDNERSLWRWREWVIDAFNTDKPFDEFTLEQLAGDLLPNPTLAQKIATGFNRCNETTGEGGLIPEEYLAKYAMDRVDTTSSVFLGLTMGCCQCHDHKFDPLSQREYYRMFAYFDSLAEQGSDENALAPPPAIRAPDPSQSSELDRLTRARDESQARLEAPMPEIDAQQPAWEARVSAAAARRWSALRPLHASSSGGSTLSVQDDASVLASGKNPDKDVYELEFPAPAGGSFAGASALQLEALTDASLPLGGAGRYLNSNFVLTGFEVERAAADGAWTGVHVERALADHSQPDFPVAAAIDSNAQSGWAVSSRPESRLAQFFFTEPLPAGTTGLRVRLRHESQFAQHGIGRLRLSISKDPTLIPIAESPWRMAGPFRARTDKEAFDRSFVAETELDLAARDEEGKALWSSQPEFEDGKAHTFRGDFSAVYLERTITSPEARRVHVAIGSDDALRVWLNGRLVHSSEAARALTLGEDKLVLDLVPGGNEILLKVVNYTGGFAFSFAVEDEEIGGVPLPVVSVLERPAEMRGENDKKLLRDQYRAFFSPGWRALRDALAAAEKTRAEFEMSIPMCMVSQDLKEPRETHVLIRGQYDKKGDVVEPGTPAALPPLPDGAPKNRLALARWIVDPSNPLTARVAVNRIWAQHFGTGIVATTRDFGAQGEWPSHRELLDWLATEFVRTGWDVKRMHELIVTSAAYRQSSRVTDELLRVDAQNRLLARGPRIRLDAEIIRDQALAAAGLLVGKIGGPSVKPYQPDGLWEVVAYPTSNTAKFMQDHGEKLYRRSLYTFWKRTSPPPSMTTFDAPSREVCICDRARTDTPLQALCLLNDVQFVEAARNLAQRTLTEGGASDEDRATHAFSLVLARKPSADERAVLLEALRAERETYGADPAAASKLVAIGESMVHENVDAAELAAWTIVASMILNLDEAVTRG